ncbi:uncharacterized protein LOC122854426, partial [Aphidius gifuensis]
MATESSKHPSGYLVAPRVPQGLAAAVEGLTREVIRQRPEDIYVFAAHHFEKLLKLRQEYGTSGIPLEKDSRTLRDMGLSHLMIPKNEKDLTRARDTAEQSGWSVNQTAKVLKRHRSIVGDIGDSGDAFTIIRSRVNNNDRISPINKYNYTNDNTSDENYQKYSKRFNQRSWSIEDRLFCSTETKNNPKIITRIPSTGMLAKDIKTELRKNRISSRERRSSRCKPDERQRSDTNEINNYDIRSSSRKSSGQRGQDDSQLRRRSSENLIESSGNRMIKTPSMDKVKDYVVHKFSTTKSIEELQSVKYVEKVQEIIDETGQIIKEKVEQLKNGIYIDKKLRSRSNSKNNIDAENKSRESSGIEGKLTETNNVLDNLSANLGKSNRRSKSARGLRRMKSVSTMSSEDSNADNTDKNEELMISALLIENRKKDGLDTRLNETKNILENIYSGFPKPVRCSRSEKGSRSNLTSDLSSQKSEELETMLNETKNISSNFTEQNGLRKSRGSGNASSLSSKSDESDHAESQKNIEVSLPVVRPPSAKNNSKNHVKNDSQAIILPAISPEVSKSASKKDEFSLPILSSPGTSPPLSSTLEDSKLPGSADSISRENYINKVQVDEVFKDSLDVTPEPLDLPLRPDSLEPEEQDLTSDLKDKLLEIQEAEKNIEKIFTTDENKETNSKDPFKEKLIELMEVEKGIEKILVDNQLVENTEENLLDKENEAEKIEILESKENVKKLEIEENKNLGESSDTYILSEKSPTDIPETVTTVIIPDFPQTPDSDSLPIDFEIGDSEAAELIPGLSMTIEELDESVDATSIPVNLESLGEVILPEDNPESSVDFVSPMDELIIIPKKDLQSINEDVLHEEELIENNNQLNSPKDIQNIEEDSGNLISTSRIDTSDISGDLTGIDNTSTLSTSAKETTVTDGQIELSKRQENSAENEELSSDTVSAETTNEAKETTVTDGTSFSLDPMRPFIPELNLDSLQDITVSSFKMTEDDNEDPGEIDQENTITSITETLTPDEHKKITTTTTTTAREEDEELNIFEFSDADLVVDVESETTGSEKIVLNESNEFQDENLITPEIIEEPCIKKYVEIVEPPFEKEIVKLIEPDVVNNESSVPDNLPDQTIDLKSDENEKKIIENNLEKASESDQGTEEIEDNFVDEDTPLAVSRSASQCTTRRVSSGNLARLKEEQRFDEGEEIEMTNESIKDKPTTPKLDNTLLKEEIKLNESLDITIVDESSEFNDLVSAGNSNDDISNENALEESRKYHIYVPELDQTEETTTITTTESSFNSAATKIQAGVRGFLTRRRFQRMHHLNSTLNSVPSIQDSIVIDGNSLDNLEPTVELEDAAKKIQSNFRSYKARQRLRREDAMQKTTLSMERAFGDNGICHTGEFHDCIPLPIFDFMKNDDNNTQTESLMTNKFDEISMDTLDKKNKQKELGMMFEISPNTPVVQFGIVPKINKLVDVVVITKDESTVQNSYLNFITSVEDTDINPHLIKNSTDQLKQADQLNDSLVEDNTQESMDFSPRKGVIIEEITSLEEAKILQEIKESSKAQSDIEENVSNEKIDTQVVQVNDKQIIEKKNDDKVNESTDNLNIEKEKKIINLKCPTQENKLSQYGSEDYSVSHDTTLTPSNPTKSLSLSQESQLAGDRIESPITMMQIVPPTRSESLVRDDSSDIPSSNDEKQYESIKDQSKILKLQ